MLEIVLLNRTHNRESFSCNKELLDNYIKKQASQDVKKKLAVCYVMTEEGNSNIIGYYTLSNDNIPRTSIPEKHAKRFPYDSLPTTLLGRLAVDVKYRGKGYGGDLLIDALKRCLTHSEVMGSFAVVVDPIDEDAENYYTRYGFIKLPDSRKMFIPMKTVKQLFNS